MTAAEREICEIAQGWGVSPEEVAYVWSIVDLLDREEYLFVKNAEEAPPDPDGYLPGETPYEGPKNRKQT